MYQLGTIVCYVMHLNVSKSWRVCVVVNWYGREIRIRKVRYRPWVAMESNLTLLVVTIFFIKSALTNFVHIVFTEISGICFY